MNKDSKNKVAFKRRVKVTKIMTFDSAHSLKDYSGPCKNLHGHTYHLEVTLSGIPDYRGLVVDFKDMKCYLKEKVVDVLDHRNMNEVLTQFNTTAENLVCWMWDVLDDDLMSISSPESELRIEKIKLFETPTSFSELDRNTLNE